MCPIHRKKTFVCFQPPPHCLPLHLSDLSHSLSLNEASFAELPSQISSICTTPAQFTKESSSSRMVETRITCSNQFLWHVSNSVCFSDKNKSTSTIYFLSIQAFANFYLEKDRTPDFPTFECLTLSSPFFFSFPMRQKLLCFCQLLALQELSSSSSHFLFSPVSLYTQHSHIHFVPAQEISRVVLLASPPVGSSLLSSSFADSGVFPLFFHTGIGQSHCHINILLSGLPNAIAPQYHSLPNRVANTFS